MAMLCYSVNVTYNNGGEREIRDSIVTFRNSGLFYGESEIIYDFAINKRHFTKNGNPKSEYYFVKVTDRIYYRRRPISMM